MKRSSYWLFAAAFVWTGAFVASNGLGARAGEPAQITVGPNVQISAQNDTKVHTEVVIGADPVDSKHLIACGIMWRDQQYTDETDTVVYSSVDGGLHWKSNLAVPLAKTSSPDAADPYCLIGNHHREYFFEHTMHSSHRYPTNETVNDDLINNVYASDDSGTTWRKIGGFPIADRPFVTIDREHPSDNDDIYVALFGEENTSPLQPDILGHPVVIYRSRDSGVSFGDWASYLNHDDVEFGGIDVLPNGRAIAALADQPKNGLGPPSAGLARGSIDVVIPKAGADAEYAESSNAPIKVSDLDACNQASYPPFPAVVVDHSNGVFHGRAYVTWPDKRFGPCRILLSYSDDGEHWSDPRIVDIDRHASRLGDDFHPAIAVNNKGIVGVAWQDRQDNPSSLGWRKRFAASIDGGQTFLASVPVSTARLRAADDSHYPVYTNLSLGDASVSRYKDAPVDLQVGLDGHPITGGETTGLAADASGTFHPEWIDNRTGILQIWTAPVTVTGNVSRNGTELAGYQDVSSLVAVVITSAQMDEQAHQLVIKSHLVNRSQHTVGGPIRMRILKFDSLVGKIGIVNADNGETEPGAIWNYSTAHGGDLLPGEISEEKTLIFSFQTTRSMLAYSKALQYDNPDPLFIGNFMDSRFLLFAKSVK